VEKSAAKAVAKADANAPIKAATNVAKAAVIKRKVAEAAAL
jgi:hypothetical protein